MPAWGVIAAKDLRLLWRDRAALFWVVGFPLVFALFFGSVMRADSESTTAAMHVVVVTEAPSADGPPAGAAEQVVSFLEQSGIRVSRASEGAARDAVRRGEAVAFVRLPIPGDATIALGIDPSRRMEAALLQSLLNGATAPEMPPGARVEVRTSSVMRSTGMPRSGYDIVFPAMILWGLLGCAAAFAVSMVAERASGSLLRLRAAPITRASILSGKAAACAIACLADALLLSSIARLLLGVQIAAASKFAAAVGAMVLCFTGLTMTLSVLGKSEQAVAGAGWATLILMAMLGGAMVPIAMFPDWLLSLSDLSPVKWGILALEGATWRDFRWGELAPPLAVLFCVGAAGFMIGVSILTAQREV